MSVEVKREDGSRFTMSPEEEQAYRRASAIYKEQQDAKKTARLLAKYAEEVHEQKKKVDRETRKLRTLQTKLDRLLEDGV